MARIDYLNPKSATFTTQFSSTYRYDEERYIDRQILKDIYIERDIEIGRRESEDREATGR